MPLIAQPVIDQILVPSLLTFFFIGGIFSLVVGLGLIVCSERMFRFFDVMNRWVSFRKAFRPMAIPRDSWPVLQRYRQWLAVIVIVAAVFAVYSLTMSIDMQRVVQYFAGKMALPPAFIGWLLSSVVWFLVLGNLMAIVVGVMLGFFPHALNSVEKMSGRWISTRHVTKEAEAMHYSLDKWVTASPRAAGSIIAVLAVAEVIHVGILLF